MIPANVLEIRLPITNMYPMTLSYLIIKFSQILIVLVLKREFCDCSQDLRMLPCLCDLWVALSAILLACRGYSMGVAISSGISAIVLEIRGGLTTCMPFFLITKCYGYFLFVLFGGGGALAKVKEGQKEDLK